MGQFCLLLIQFPNLPPVFLYNHLAGRCSIQQSELLQTKGCICFHLGAELKEGGEQSDCSSSSGLWDHTAPSTYS